MISGLLKFLLLMVCLRINTGSQFLELNHDLGPDTGILPEDRISPFVIEFLEADSKRGYWLAQNNYKFVDIIGTSVIAPYMYDPKGRTIDEIPFDDLFAQAVVIDVKDKVVKNPLYQVSVEDISNWVKKYGKFPSKTVVIFNTGWEEGRWPDRTAYLGIDNPSGDFIHPGVSIEAAKALLKYEKSQGIRIVGLGIDSSTFDYGPAGDKLPVIHLLAEADKYLIYNLRDIKRLPPIGARIMTMPMKVRNGTAAPARLAARLPLPY